MFAEILGTPEALRWGKLSIETIVASLIPNENRKDVLSECHFRVSGNREEKFGLRAGISEVMEKSAGLRKTYEFTVQIVVRRLLQAVRDRVLWEQGRCRSGNAIPQVHSAAMARR
jgi:hypothetical protein